ncbi:MAG TPA: hypothetical protein DDY43_12425 [Synechococcales bacterium UBA10510]|nr:hypothetical protein [Synechococcales bacterium UBA10510]
MQPEGSTGCLPPVSFCMHCTRVEVAESWGLGRGFGVGPIQLARSEADEKGLAVMPGLDGIPQDAG